MPFDSRLDANQVLRKSYNDAKGALDVTQVAQLVPEKYDYIALTYVTSGNGLGEIETVTYKDGGASGTLVATLTLGYDASNNLVSVARS